MGSYYLMGIDEKVVEMNGGNGCTKILRYLMSVHLMHCILKDG